MNKIWLLACSNFRKNKGATITLGIIIFVAALLLNLGLLSYFNFKKAFDEKAENMNTAHITTVMLESKYKERYYNFFKDHPEVTQAEKESVIFLMVSDFYYAAGETFVSSVFLNMDNERNISHVSIVGETDETGEMNIYVPYMFQTGGGYKLGDEFTIKYREKKYDFHIAGFTEDINLGSINMGCTGFYLPNESYIQFQEEIADEGTNGILLKMLIFDSTKAQDIISEYHKIDRFDSNLGYVKPAWTINIGISKSVRTMTADIGGVIIIAFSMIILLISLITIKFRISNSIEDQMTDFGALKALGYTSLQIIKSILLYFLCVAGFGAVLGIMTSYLAVTPVSDSFGAQTGITWKQGFSPFFSLVSLCCILTAVLVITLVSSGRMRKLHPITALRNGIRTHSHLHNHFPLVHMRMSLNLALALKSMISNMKQNLMIMMIIASVSFASVFGIIMYYNIVLENKAFIDMVGMEQCSLSITSLPGTDAKLLLDDIKTMEGIKKADNYDFGSVEYDDEMVMAYIMEDFSRLNNKQVYNGRYPKYDNELAINGLMAERYDKNIGDTISITKGTVEEEYLITGLIQNSNYMGMNIAITLEGIRQMVPDYTFCNINIYLKEGVESEPFIKDLTDQFGDRIVSTINMDNMIKSQLGVYVSVVTLFAYFIVFITIIMIILILTLIIKALVIRRRKDYGIQKAIGYTTYQLMTQISISFLPVVFAGAVLGSVIGGLYMNSLITVLFRGIGVMTVNFVVPVPWIIFMCMGIGLISYAASMLVSWRIRKINAYTLIVE